MVVKIIVPRKLDDDAKTLVEQLAAKAPVQARADVRW